MTRRQFLACLLMALVVLVCLPLVKFTEWGEKWFGRQSYEFRMSSYPTLVFSSPFKMGVITPDGFARVCA